LLELLSSGIEATAHMSLIAPITKEARFLATGMSHSRDFYSEINPHDRLPLGAWNSFHRQGNIRYPLATLFLDTEYPWFARQGDICASNANLLRFSLKVDGKNKYF